MSWHRRDVLIGGGASLLAAPLTALAAAKPEQQIAALENNLRARIGVAALDTGSGAKITWRDGERFAMCSTFKWLLAAAILSRCEHHELALAQKLSFSAVDLHLPHSPITTTRQRDGDMSIAALCEAAVVESDNLAANTLLHALGGPPALTAWLRSIGDPTTRLDRFEIALNENRPGDPRDTTTPEAMIATMRRVLLGDVITSSSREMITGWMQNCRTGLASLRAGLPREWRVGDKTGHGTG